MDNLTVEGTLATLRAIEEASGKAPVAVLYVSGMIFQGAVLGRAGFERRCRETQKPADLHEFDNRSVSQQLSDVEFRSRVNDILDRPPEPEEELKEPEGATVLLWDVTVWMPDGSQCYQESWVGRVSAVTAVSTMPLMIRKSAK